MLSILWLYIYMQSNELDDLYIMAIWLWLVVVVVVAIYIYAVKRFSSATPSFISSISGYLY